MSIELVYEILIRRLSDSKCKFLINFRMHKLP